MSGLFLNGYPYTDFHELNLSWLLNQFSVLKKEIEDFVSINALKYADPIQWNITTQYEKNTIVIEPVSGTAYISLQPVPAGVSIYNTDYWTEVFSLDRFITAANNNFTANIEIRTNTATMALNIGDWVIWEYELYEVIAPIIAGDQYVTDSNIKRIRMESYIGLLVNLTTDNKDSIVEAINSLVDNVGGLPNLQTIDKTSIVNAINELVSSVSDIRDNVIGDLSSLHTSDTSSIVAAINETFDLEDVLTPYMFGAVGDGVTDDTQAFIDMFADNSKPIHINKGNFRITDTITVYSNTSVYGSEEATIIDAIPVGASYTYPAVFDITARDYVTIEGVNVTGVNETITGGSSQYRSVFNIVNSEHVRVSGCTLLWSDCLYVFRIKSSNHIIVSDCFINHYNYIALTLLIPCSHCEFIRNIVMNCDNYTYNTNGQNYGIDFSGFDSALSPDAVMNSDILIEGNYVSQTHGTWEGIGGHGGKRVKIINNTILNAYCGIAIDTKASSNYYANDIIIADNYIELSIENYVGDVVKHNEAILVSGNNIDVHNNICKYGGWAGSLVATFDDPTAIGIYGGDYIKFHDNLITLNRGNVFKLKGSLNRIEIANNTLDYLYWAVPYGAYKATVYNIHDVTLLSYLSVHDNVIDRFELNDWYIFGKDGDAVTAFGYSDPYIIFKNDIFNSGRTLVNNKASNIITDTDDITTVLMGHVGDTIYNTDANTSDPIGWICTKKWTAGAGGRWTSFGTV